MAAGAGGRRAGYWRTHHRSPETFGKLFNAGTAFKRDGSQFDHLFADGASFRIGNLQAMSLHVPGHTPACLAYVIGDAVFPGDTLFMPDYGTARCDFQVAQRASCIARSSACCSCPTPPRIPVPRLQSHRPGPFRMGNYHRCRKGNNMHVHEGVSEAMFVELREARDATLPMPRLILPSVQVNMCAGHLPEPEENGVRYLKLPVDLL
jgi:hypothetical protein